MKCQEIECDSHAECVLKTKTVDFLTVEIYLCRMHYLGCFNHTTEKQLKEILNNAVLAPEILN